MPTLYLVRHGKPAAAFDADLDPGLDATGREQADESARALAPRGPLPLLSSPLARARETAKPLAERWQRVPWIEKRVAELPSPSDDLSERGHYVRGVMDGDWSSVDDTLTLWRRALIEWAQSMESDAVVFSHFIAINVLVGVAQRDDRVLVFRPDHASITTLRTGPTGIELESLGREADTGVR